MKRFMAIVVGIFVWAGVLPSTAVAAGLPVIVSATVDYTHSTMTVAGQNFGSNSVVALDSVTFPTASAASNKIVANFPGGSPPSSFVPGTYSLTVRNGNQPPALFALTIGASGRRSQGVQGVAGPAGPQGQQGIQGSTGAAGPAGPPGPSSTLSCPNGNIAVTDGHYIDCGDGTLIDANTGLMWEKAVTCGAQNLAIPLCVENLYTYCVSSCGPGYQNDGSLFTQFLALLNDDIDSTGTTPCFAGHCDWRIPKITELETILSATYPCGTCIDTAFGPNESDYWSSTATPLLSVPAYAWGVSFSNWANFFDAKGDNHSARAVRGGR